jgi:hypothetical protein
LAPAAAAFPPSPRTEDAGRLTLARLDTASPQASDARGD